MGGREEGRKGGGEREGGSTEGEREGGIEGGGYLDNVYHLYLPLCHYRTSSKDL